MTEATAPEVVSTTKSPLVPAVAATVDAQLAADIEQDIIDDGGFGRRTTIAIQLLRTDGPKIQTWLERYLAELKDSDARDEVTRLKAYFLDRLGAIETLVPQHKASASGTVHFSDEAWAETRAGAPVAEAARTVALTRLGDQPALKEQFSPGVVLDSSPQRCFDAVKRMINALTLPDKQALYKRKRIRAAKLVALLTTVETKLGLALAGGVTAEPRTGEVSAAIEDVLLQIAAADDRIESEFIQELRPDLANAFAALIPRRHGGHKSDQKPAGDNPPPQNPPPTPPPSSADQKPSASPGDAPAKDRPDPGPGTKG